MKDVPAHDRQAWNGIFTLLQWGNEESLRGNKEKARVIWKVYEQVLERYQRARKMYPYG